MGKKKPKRPFAKVGDPRRFCGAPSVETDNVRRVREPKSVFESVAQQFFKKMHFLIHPTIIFQKYENFDTPYYHFSKI
jgi:hypothetical protein